MAEPFDFSELKAVAFAPEMTLDMYRAFPEDASRMIEVVDGWVVRCESAGHAHQTIARNLANHLWAAVKGRDAKERTCHRVDIDLDVLISDEPKLHFRRPDVVVYRCIDPNRGGKWPDKPYASDGILVVEIVSPDSVTTDLRDKRAEYAAAGIPHYWIVRMEDNNGPAISIERLRLVAGGSYIAVETTVRRVDFHAVTIGEPFVMKLAWEELDDGL
jgi:Uma2 family endonuclease